MSEHFTLAEADYKAAKAKIDAIISDASRATGTTAFARHEASARAPLEDAKMAVQAMELAARSTDEGPTKKKQLTMTVKTYKADLRAAQQNLDAAGRAAERAELMGGAAGSGSSGNLGSSDKARLMQTQQKLDQASESLDNTRRMVQETEQVASATVGQLHAQGQQLRDAHGQVVETTQATREARTILRRMAVQAVQNKIILILIIIILLAAIGYVAYDKFIKNHNPTPAPTPAPGPGPTRLRR